MENIKSFLLILFFLAASKFMPGLRQENLAYLNPGNIDIQNAEISQFFYDELKGQPRNYFINSDKNFVLNLNVLVPEIENRNGRYSVKINDKEEILENNWEEFYDSFDREYYLKSPEIEKELTAGKYKIEIFSAENSGKYVLAVGKNQPSEILPILNLFWQMPLLKIAFFKTSVLQFLFTPVAIFGIAILGAVIIILALLNFIIGAIAEAIKHKKAKTLLLTSNGMQMKEEIKKLLQKPAYDITVAFITTAAKPEENLDYVKRDWEIMRNEMGFNVEEIDIEGKKEKEVMRLLQLKDIIFVEGGNTFYLLKAMRKCHFEKIIRKLLKLGKVYIGSSAGSIVAGQTIKTSTWKHKIERFGIKKNARGLNLVPFDIFVHYTPEHAALIKKKKPFRWQRRKLKIITDDQAILVQGSQVAIIGKEMER